MDSKSLSDDALANPACGRDKVRMWERSAAFPLVVSRMVTVRGLRLYGQRTRLAPQAMRSSTGNLSVLQPTVLALELGPQVRLRLRSSLPIRRVVKGIRQGLLQHVDRVAQ